jgi:hypothetical protein
MSFSLTWLPDVLLQAGLKVAYVPGWQTRGRGDAGQIQGVLCHHTVGVKTGNMPSLGTLVSGRPDLVGPLAQLGLGRDGTFYVIAAGKCNHAGSGTWQGITDGDESFIGIEAENTGGTDDPWPAAQVEAFQRGVAAILQHVSAGAEHCAGHKEYAPDRKKDPTLDMDAFRKAVGAILAGTAAAPALIPAAEPPTKAGGAAGRRTLRRGMRGVMVATVQQRLRVTADGIFGGKTEAAVRTFQRSHQLVPDGIVGPRTWAALDAQSQPLRAVNQ